MYVNIKTLYELLKPLDPLDKHYLGKWSVNKKERIPVRRERERARGRERERERSNWQGLSL